MKIRRVLDSCGFDSHRPHHLIAASSPQLPARTSENASPTILRKHSLRDRDRIQEPIGVREIDFPGGRTPIKGPDKSEAESLRTGDSSTWAERSEGELEDQEETRLRQQILERRQQGTNQPEEM
jgi:hypothetical protein